MDLKEAVAAEPDAEDEKKAVADARAIADLIWQVHQLPKPTIAALNGDALAGGAGLAAACDFVVAAEGARIGYPEVRRGLVAAIVMHDLIRQVGDRRARDLLLSGRPIGAAEAERWGLVNRVVPAESLPGRGDGPGPLARRVGPPRRSRRPSGCSTRRAAGPPTLAARPPSPRPSASRTRPARGFAPSSRNAPRAGPRRPARRGTTIRSSRRTEGQDGASGPAVSDRHSRRPVRGERPAQFHTEDAMVRHDDEQTPWVADQTVGDALRITASRFPDRDALVFPALGLRWSWGELDRRVDLAASGLIARGVGRGEHVGIWSMNVPEWVVTQFAVGRIGAVLVNINPAYRLHELEETLAAGRRGDPDRRQPVQGVELRRDGRGPLPRGGRGVVAVVDRRRGCLALRRLIALGDRPGPGWLTWADLEAGPDRRASWPTASARRGPPTSTTSSSPRGRPGSPRGRCSPITTSS